MTMVEMMAAVKFNGEQENALVAKNLFLSDKKNKDKIFLVCAAHDTEIDMKALTKALGVGSGNLRAGSLEKMYEKLGAKKGLVNLFAIMNDTPKAVTLVSDKRLTEAEYVAYHPMDNTATTAIKSSDQAKIIQMSEHEPKILDFASMAPAAGAGGAAAAGAKTGGQKQKPQQQPKQQQKGKKQEKP